MSDAAFSDVVVVVSRQISLFMSSLLRPAIATSKTTNAKGLVPHLIH
jgi:hypothetical protein